MNVYHFTILMRDAVYQDDLEDKLFAAGLDDALLYSKNNAVCLIFDREAENAKQAVETAMAQIRQAGFTDLILQETGFVSLSEIAKRSGLTRSAITQYASGKREGNFPRPMFITGDSALYSWRETAQWLYQHGKISQSKVEIATL